jgi:hypothetical protein
MSDRVNLSVAIAEIYTADCTFNAAQQQVVGRETNLEKSLKSQSGYDIREALQIYKGLGQRLEAGEYVVIRASR